MNERESKSLLLALAASLLPHFFSRVSFSLLLSRLIVPFLFLLDDPDDDDDPMMMI